MKTREIPTASLLLVGLLGLSGTALSAQEIKDPNPPIDRGGACTEGVDCVSPANDSTGRLDQFGYTFFSDASGQCAAGFQDLSATGTQIDWSAGLGFDDNSAPVTIDSFNFYGVDYSELTVSTNGYISTDPTDGGTSLGNNGSLCPNPEPLLSGGGARIHALLDDLVSETAYYEYFEQCPRQSDRCRAPEPCTIVHWADTYHFGDTIDDAFGVEAVLYHWTNDLVVQYSGTNPEDGLNSTVGLQDVPGTPGPPYPTSTPLSGITYQCDYPSSMLTGASVCFNHPNTLPDPCVYSDVSISKFSDADDRMEIGQQVVYSLTVENAGPDPARQVVVTDDLGDDVTYVSDDCSAGAPTDSIWTWSIGTMSVSSLQSCNITVQVTGERETTVDNTAVATLDNHDEDESNNTSNLVSFDIGYISDMSIEKTSNAAPRVEPGTQVVYTITVTNDGPDETVNAMVTDQLPAGVSYVSDTCGGGLTTRGVVAQWEWDPGVIQPESSVMCMITVTVVGPRGTTVQNSASIAIDNIDPTPDNNQDSTSFDIGFRSDLSITKTTDAASAVDRGAEVIYTLTVSNPDGPDPSINTTVVDVLPDTVQYLNNDCGAPDPADATFTWTIGTLAVDATEVCNVTVEVTGLLGTVENTATVSQDSIETDSEDNSDQADFIVEPSTDGLFVDNFESGDLSRWAD